MKVLSRIPPDVVQDKSPIIRLKDLTYEDFVQYKKPSMFLGTCFCDFKCQKENPDCHCQNSPAYQAKVIEYPIGKLIERYQLNQLTKAVVFGGFEPMLQIGEVLDFIKEFRSGSEDDIVIYTGYREDEIKTQIELLRKYSNIVLKVGRYIPNQHSHYDSILGVELASDNQYAIRL